MSEDKHISVDDVLKETEGRIHPIALVREPEEALGYGEVAGKTAENIIAKTHEIERLLKKLNEEAMSAEGVPVMSSVRSLSGTPQEIGEKIVALNSRLKGMKAAYMESAMSEDKAERAKAFEAIALAGGPAPDPRFTEDKAVGTEKPLYDHVEAALKEMGIESHSDMLKAIDKNGAIDIEVGGDRASDVLAQTMERTDYDPPEEMRPGYVPKKMDGVQVASYFATETTNTDTVRYMKEVLHKSAAAETREGNKAPESEYRLTDAFDYVVRIPHVLPVTEEAMADQGNMRGYINDVMPFGVMNKLDAQLISGTGADLAALSITPAETRSDPQPTGRSTEHQEKQLEGMIYRLTLPPTAHTTDNYDFNDTSGAQVFKYTRTSSRISYPWEILAEVADQLRTYGGGGGTSYFGGQMATHAFLNPTFMREALTYRTSQGEYQPFGVNGGALLAPFGLSTMVTTNRFTNDDSANAKKNLSDLYTKWNFGGMLGDMSARFSSIVYRHGIMMQVGTSSDDFDRFKFRIRASVRVAFAVRREAAFCLLINPIAAGTIATSTANN